MVREVTEVQGYRVAGLQGYRVARLQGCKVVVKLGIVHGKHFAAVGVRAKSHYPQNQVKYADFPFAAVGVLANSHYAQNQVKNMRALLGFRIKVSLARTPTTAKKQAK